jgi:hypothetical protein
MFLHDKKGVYLAISLCAGCFYIIIADKIFKKKRLKAAVNKNLKNVVKSDIHLQLPLASIM